jgi:AbrB family looped-hinge helix DNA binding protein
VKLRGVKLLRTKHTDSRQFTIPREVREAYGIKPGDEVEIINIEPFRL